MRSLLNLVAALCLIASLMAGSLAHASEAAGTTEVSVATAWLHVDGDHDQVPADADKNYPHHHNVCHGHDLAAAAKAPAAPLACSAALAPQPLPDAEARTAAPGTPLRPPIA